MLIKSETTLKGVDKEYTEYKKIKTEEEKDSQEWYYRYKHLEGSIEEIKQESEAQQRRFYQQDEQNKKIIEELREKAENAERQVKLITEKYASYDFESSEETKRLRNEYEKLVQNYKEIKSERDLLKLENQVLQNMSAEVKQRKNNSNLLREKPVHSPISYNLPLHEKENISNFHNLLPVKPSSPFGNRIHTENSIHKYPEEKENFKSSVFKEPKSQHQLTEEITQKYCSTGNEERRMDSEARAQREELEQVILGKKLFIFT